MRSGVPPRKTRWLCCASLAAAWLGGLAGAQADAPGAWAGLSVEVGTEPPGRLQVVQQLKEQPDGFTRLEVSLVNGTSAKVEIREIVIRLPLGGQLEPSASLLFGGTCMGRTPIRRATAADAEAAGLRSAMFVLARTGAERLVFAGACTWNTFMPYISLEQGAFVVRSQGEGKLLLPGGRVDCERILLAHATDSAQLLDAFGTAIAKTQGIGPLKPETFTGWATWDYYGRVFGADDVLGNLAALRQLAPSANLLQIDGGWWTERGDYTSVRPDLEGGIRGLAGHIADGGQRTGLHFDGFRGDADSQICRTHPEYFLHDQDGRLLVDEDQKPDRLMRYTFFDYSHPGARAHIAECIRVMKEEWGIRYFKVDFMRYGLEEGIRSRIKELGGIRAHEPGLTSVERFRLGLRAIRDAIGKDDYFLGCSAVFGPCIGFVDGMRTGADISPSFDHFAPRVLGNAGNYYLNGKVFHADCDYLVVRAAEDEDQRVSRDPNKRGGNLSLKEARMWTHFAMLFGNARLASDNLMLLRPERKELLRLAFSFPFMEETVPLDLWDHAGGKDDAFEWILARGGGAIYLGAFNWGEQDKTFRVAALGEGATLTDLDGPAVAREGEAATWTLPGHTSRLFRYEGPRTFAELRKNLVDQVSPRRAVAE